MKLKIALRLIIAFCCIRFNGVTSQQPYCVSPGSVTKGPNDPPFPTLPTSFQTTIEANLNEDNVSMTATEYFDGVNNRAALYIRAGGSVDTIIFNYQNNEIYQIQDNLVCEVTTNISADPTSVMFGGVKNNATGMPHMYTTAGIMKFSQTGQIYNGTALIRGILTNHWRTCLSWPSMNANFTLDYYFSADSWQTADSTGPAPVRAEVIGVVTTPGTPSNPQPKVSTFHHIYEYIDFRNSVEADPSVFETPAGVVCPGRKKTRSLPQLKTQYRYREEIIAPFNQWVTEADVWYDYTYGLARSDYRTDPTNPPFYTDNVLTYIRDFNTGIAYVIDNLVGNCTIKAIDNGTWDSFSNNSFSQMRDPRQVFFLDAQYEYAGVRKARNIDCDVFIANRSDYNPDGFGPYPAVFTIYFMTTDWNSATSVGSDAATTAVPVRLEIDSPINNYDMLYDFYDFDEEHPNILKSFDISPCYQDSEKINFRMTFPTTSTSFMDDYQVIFVGLTMAQISSSAHISPLRIQHSQAHWDINNVYFVGTLLEKPPVIAKYRQNPTKVSRTYNDVTLTNVMDARTCARTCDSYANFTCNSFDYCASQQICTFSRSYTSNGAQADNTAQCDHYSRVLSGPPSTELPLQDAWTFLKDLLYKGGIVITFTTANSQNIALKATDITDKVLINPTRTTSNPLTHFTGQTNKEIKGYDDAIFTGDSVDDCASQCENELVFTCQAFEYCYNNAWCTLTRMHPDDRPDLVIQSDNCDLYIRDYTAKYTKTPGTTVLSDSDTIYQNIFSDNQCAKLCSDYSGFSCKSFDYCPDINTCFLGKKHIFDVPRANVKANPSCSHYSRSYSADFSATRNKVISMMDDRVVVGVSPDQCAKMCVEEESFECASFDYCANSTECRLSTADMRNVGQVTYEASNVCDVYQRQYYPDGRQYLSGGSKANKGYSSGTMAGLGIGMILIGILVGMVGVIVFFKHRRRFSDGLELSFTNKEHVPE